MTPSLMALAFVLVLIVCVLIVFNRFNTLVRSQKRVQEAWAGIDVQLRQRASLIPNLVEAIRGYAEHEREVYEEVARARGALQKAGTAGQAGTANNLLTQALGHVFAVAEAYPQLHASENFMSLRSDLRDVEEKIAFARQFYNRNVLDYNTRIDTYPDAFIAHNFDFAPAEFFEAEGDGRAEVKISFAPRPAGREHATSPPAA
ncbi:MAG TPA: LemA family protein [Vicinamibacterales bacterium]|jgi:LemA protein